MEGTSGSEKNVPDFLSDDSEEHTGASSEVTETEPDDTEVESLAVNMTGIF